MGKRVEVKRLTNAIEEKDDATSMHDVRRSKTQTEAPKLSGKAAVIDKPISELTPEELQETNEHIQRGRVQAFEAHGGDEVVPSAVKAQIATVEAGAARAKIDDPTVPDKGLGRGDGLELIARALNLPMPEDPRVELPGGERQELASVWADVAGTKQAAPPAKMPTELPERLAVGSKIDISFEEEKRRVLKFEDVPNDPGKSKTLNMDDDPISRALGVSGWIADQSWSWLREPSSNPALLGKKLKVTRFYFQPELPVNVVVDYLPATPKADYERRIKELLCLQHGIAYLGVMPDQQANKGALLEAIKKALTVKQLMAAQPEAVAA